MDGPKRLSLFFEFFLVLLRMLPVSVSRPSDRAGERESCVLVLRSVRWCGTLSYNVQSAERGERAHRGDGGKAGSPSSGQPEGREEAGRVWKTVVC